MASVSAFLQQKAREGLREKTIRWYRMFIQPWEEVRPEEPDIEAAHAFATRWTNPRTQAGAWRAIRAYERWRATEEGAPDWTQGVRWRVETPPVNRMLTQGDFEKMVGGLDRRDLRQHRDFAFLSLLWYTGLRRDAARLARVSDVDLHERTIRVRTKGGVVGVVAVGAPAVEVLREWIPRLYGSPDWLFPSTRDAARPIESSWLSSEIRRLARRAEIPYRVWLHGLRHAFATRLLDAGVPLEVVQRQLLHASIQSTLVYARVSVGRARSEVDRVFG